MANYGVIPSRAIWLHIQSTCPQCAVQFEFPNPSPAPPLNTTLRIRCFKCGTIVTHIYGAGPQQPTSKTEDPKTEGAKKRVRIGTQERPIERAYYEILGVEIDATTEEIKRAYRRLAIKHHPDKNRADPNAEETFKQISIAYQTLSDPVLRKKYNEFGSRESQPEGGFMDPEAFFSQLFGGERFIPFIGHIALGRDMKTALQEDGEGEGEVAKRIKASKNLSPEEKARKDEKARKEAVDRAAVREERVRTLADELARKLSIFTESTTGDDDADVTRSWRTICELDAEQLKHESYGAELLHTIGFVYASKARHHLASNKTFMGVGGWLHNVQGKYHVFSETMSTIKAAVDLKQTFDQIAVAEKSGNLSPDEKRKLEEAAAEKGIQALFKGTKLEIESVLRETCERVLAPTDSAGVPSQKLHLRAIALQIMGEAFMAVRKEGVEESEYVRVENRASRERERG